MNMKYLKSILSPWKLILINIFFVWIPVVAMDLEDVVLWGIFWMPLVYGYWLLGGLIAYFDFKKDRLNYKIYIIVDVISAIVCSSLYDFLIYHTLFLTVILGGNKILQYALLCLLVIVNKVFNRIIKLDNKRRARQNDV